MKKIFNLCINSCNSTSLFVGRRTNSNSTDIRSDDIVILFTNDVHCGINEGLGLATLATYKNELGAEYDVFRILEVSTI